MSVAPSSDASASFSGSTSTATMRAAPASRAPWITARPTPPQPMTATDEPSCTGVAQSAAPAPVEKPQAIRHACSAGSSSGIFTAHASCTITRSANVPQRSTRIQHGAVGGAVHAALRAQIVRAATRIPALARATGISARRTPGDHDPIAGLDGRDTLADLFDDASALVAEQDREPHAPPVRLDDVQVGVADAARLDPHLHLVRPGRVERDLLNRRPHAGLCVDEAACHSAARRSCSSSGTSGSWNVSTAAGSVTTLSPSSSMVS